MTYLLNIIYLLGLVCLSPWLIFKALTTGKYGNGLGQKLLGFAPHRRLSKSCVWFHGVSVGEIHLLRQVVACFRQAYPKQEIVVSTTTLTGYGEAKKHFAGMTVFYYPFDVSWSVKNALRRINPSLVVLAESELWPNFLSCCKKRRIKVAVINGRMSPASTRRYQRLRFLSRLLVDKVDLWAMQNEEFAANIRALLEDQAKVHVTGNVKYDGVNTNRDNAATTSFRKLFRIGDDELVLVAGSTQAPEEQIIIGIYHRLKPKFPSLRLILVPRHAERFAEVAGILESDQSPFLRRSQPAEDAPNNDSIILVDTLGELSAVWGLADIAYVGGSMDGRRGGQNMIEPAAYGAAVLFGPHTWNFKQTVQSLLKRSAAFQINNAVELEERIDTLLKDKVLRQRLGNAAQEFVKSQQGAAWRTIELLSSLLPADAGYHEAA